MLPSPCFFKSDCSESIQSSSAGLFYSACYKGRLPKKKIRKKCDLVLNLLRMPFIFCPFRLAKFGQIMAIKIIFGKNRGEGGGEGGLAKDQNFSVFFFRHTPLIEFDC